MADNWYYDFLNPNIALKKALLERGLLCGLRYIKDITSTKISMFRYKNIEKITNLTSEILETALLFSTNLCFYKGKGLPLGLYRYVNAGDLNEYNKPILVNVMTLKGVIAVTDVPYEDIILVRDNALDIIPFICECEYIMKMQNIDNKIDRILEICALPLLITGTKKAANDLKIIAKKVAGPDPMIVGDDKILDQVKAFPIEVPVLPTELYELKTKYKNECLSSMGIYSIEEKKERKIVSEVAAQNDFTDTVYQDMLTQRKAFIEELNKLDPTLNIEIEESYRMNFKQFVLETLELAKAEAAANGNNKKEEGNNERTKD